MQGLSLSSFGPISPMIPPVAVPKFIALPAVNPTGSSAASGSSSSSTVSASPAAPGKAASGGSSHAHGASAPAASCSVAEEMATSYSTTVAGQQYLGSVEESGGEYTASVANLSRATAIGSSVQAAENNLDTRIDELV